MNKCIHLGVVYCDISHCVCVREREREREATFIGNCVPGFGRGMWIIVADYSTLLLDRS